MKPARILLVEDETVLLRILSESLEEEGYAVQTAPTADAAWSMICKGLAFDVLVTDVRMPGQMDGLDLAHRINSHRQNVRIVVMSGFSSSINVDHRWATFLKKPFTSATLMAAIAPEQRSGAPA